MTEVYIGPDVKPYLDFHHLKDQSRQAIERSEEYLYRPAELYQRLLSLLAQNMDKTLQAKAEKSLREHILGTKSLRNLKAEEKSEVRGQRDRYKDQYFKELTQYSGNKALNQVMSSERTSARYKDGLAGGSPKIDTSNINDNDFPHRSIRPEIRVLSGIDSRLLNQDMIKEAFESYIPSTFSRRGAFLRTGFTLGSPEYKLHLLARLELTAKRHMIFPILDEIKYLSLDSVSVFFPGGEGRTPLDQKRTRLEKLILGNTDKPDFQTRMGTAFFGGYLELIHQCRIKVLSQLPKEDRARVLKIVNAVTFMRTRQKKPGQSGEQLISQVLKFAVTKEYDAAEKEIKRLMFENPRLWPTFMKGLFELTPTELEEFKRLDTEERERKARESQEKREMKRKELPQSLDDRDPSLKERVKPLIGQTFTVTDPFGTITYHVIEITERRQKKDLPPQAGYVKIRCKEVTIDGETHINTSLHTYGATLRLAEQAEPHLV